MPYLLIFLAAYFEGPLATLGAGALCAGDAALHPVQVFIAAGLGNLAADLSWYLIGGAGVYRALFARLPWLSCRQELIDGAGRMMQEHAIRFLVISKLGLGLATIPVLIAAGAAGVRWYRVLPAVLCCEIIWTGTLVLTASTVARRLTGISGWLPYYQVVGVSLFLVGLYVLTRRPGSGCGHQVGGRLS